MTRRFCLLVFFPVLCGLVHLVANIPIFNTSYDQIHELAGAAGLFAGRGYVGIDDLPIKSWPPFYSLYVAAWLHLNNSFYTVAVSNAVLVGLIAAAWSHFIAFFAETFGTRRHCNSLELRPALRWLLPIATLGSQLMIVDVLRFPSASAIFALLLPLFAKGVIRISLYGITTRRVFALSTLSMLFANSHNIAPIVIAAFSLVFFIMLWFREYVGRAGVVLLSFFCGSVSWIAVRWMFALSGSHEFSGLFQAGRDWQQAVSDLTIGLADAVMSPSIFGVGIICALFIGSFVTLVSAEPPARSVLLATLASVVLTYVVMFVVFLSVPIDSSIDGRFLLVALLIIFSLVPIVSLPSRRVLFVLAIVTFSLPLLGETARVSKWFARIQFQSVYQRYDYVVPGDAPVNASTIKKVLQLRCAKSECPMSGGLLSQEH